MKRLNFLILILAVSSCEKDDIFDDIGFYGEGTALLNGVEWKGKTGIFPLNDPRFVNCLPDTCISILIQKYNDIGELRSKVLLNKVPLRLGKFQFNPIEPSFLDTIYRITYSEFTSDGDVVTGIYSLKEADSSYFLEIIELNKQSGDIRGKFRAKVVRDTAFIGTFPDTINIEDGNFYGKINWK
ncbi:MAG: hypothetical protein IPM34_14860 [Saprospiraceae bacterium]|nr:hypothetical protein [Saprospiraceae bacterium]